MSVIVDCGKLGDIPKRVSEDLNIELIDTLVSRFNCGETRVEINKSIRGKRVFIFQGFSQTVNDDLMDLLTVISAAKSASADEITVVIPYMCYSRQERKTKPREPITARLVADLITTAGANRTVTVDLHAPAIQGFYPLLDNLYSMSVFGNYIKSNIIKDNENTVIVAPDFGCAKMARKYKEYLSTKVVIIEKSRSTPGSSSVVELYGDDVSGMDCVIIDDIIDTGGTVCNASSLLKERGAKSVHLVITHPVLSNNAVDRLEKSDFDSIHLGNTISHNFESEKIKTVDFAPLLSRAVYCIINGESISSLYN